MSWLKRVAGPGAAFLFGVGLQLSGWSVHWLGWILIGVAVVWALLAVPALSGRLPSVSLERGDGVALRIRRPELTGRRKLRADTLALVRREAQPGAVVRVGENGITAHVCELPFAAIA